MRRELNELIRHIVNARFAVENVAHEVIQHLHKGESTTYRGHEWEMKHFQVMEKVHQGIEAAWHYSKWLQFPEMDSRLEDGFRALSQVMTLEEMILTGRLTFPDLSIASPAAIGRPVVDVNGKETVMARTTVADLEKVIEELQEQFENHVENLNGQIAELEQRVDEMEGSADQRKSRGRQMTDEERKAAGERMQMGRAKKLGLDSIEQLHALKLRPGQKPTKAQIKKVKEEFPAN